MFLSPQKHLRCRGGGCGVSGQPVRVVSRAKRGQRPFERHYLAKKLCDQDQWPFHYQRKGRFLILGRELVIRVTLNGDEEWAEAFEGEQDFPIPYPEEWKKTRGHGLQICGDSIAGRGSDAIGPASKQTGENKEKDKAKHTVENMEQRKVEMAVAAWTVFLLFQSFHRGGRAMANQWN